MNFKKCTSLFLVILLLVSNIGLAFNVHYCAGEIASVSSVYNVEEVCEMPETSEAACCSKELKSAKKSCCSDKVVDLDDKTDDVIVKIFSFQTEMPFLVSEWKPLDFSQTTAFQSTEAATYYCDAHAPPLFKLYSQYIFYA